MGRRTVHVLFCLFLLSLVVYFYIYHVKPADSHRRDFERNAYKATSEIPTVVVFENKKDGGKGNCSSALAPPYATVDRSLKWQKVGSELDWYIYSAYADNRLQNSTVRLIAMSKGDAPPQKLFCRVWYGTMKSSIEEIRKQELWIHAWDMAKPDQYYQPFLLSCPSLANSVAVSVVGEPCEHPQNLVNLTSPDGHGNKSKDFVVCLKPLNFQEDISLRILEWLELQFLLGADRVFAYIYHVHPRTWKVLKHYEKTGKVGIRIHTLPGKAQTGGSLWQKRRHEMAVYNDCFYRHIHSHKFVVNLDMDEAIVPVTHASWKDMLEDARLQPSASISAPNVYFFDSFGETTDKSVPRYMHMLRHVFRSANFTPPGFAQKSFFSTNYTLTVSNHYTLQTLSPRVRIMTSVGIHFAHLHHYRGACPPSMEKDCENNYLKFRTEDKTLWKFKDRLIQNVQKRLQEIDLGDMQRKM